MARSSRRLITLAEQKNARELRISRFLIAKSLGRNRVILVVRRDSLVSY